MNNYPDGMTREHWAHIDGEAHFVDCPQSEWSDPRDWESDNPNYDNCLCDEIAQAHKEDADEHANSPLRAPYLQRRREFDARSI